MQSLLQTQEWAMVKESQGWHVHWIEEILVLEKPLPLGMSFLYAPEVDFYQIDFSDKEDPSTPFGSTQDRSLRMTTFLEKIGQISKKSNSIFIRLDFLNQKSSKINEKIPKILTKLGFIKSFEEIQPEFRQIINITGSEDEILAQMKPKGRYNIRVAEKNNVAVEKSENIGDFYEIFRETAKRDGFEIRPKKYFEDLVKILKTKDLVEVLVAKYNGKAVAAGIFTFYNDTATYLYGASSNADRQVMAPYLLHWEAIREAKKRDCKFYDLLAVSPFETKSKLTAKDKKLIAKYAGITRFKEQFGGHKIQTIGSWDLVHKPILYLLFKWAEKIRRH